MELRLTIELPRAPIAGVQIDRELGVLSLKGIPIPFKYLSNRPSFITIEISDG